MGTSSPVKSQRITSGLKETFIKGYIADDLLSEVRERSLDSGSTAPTCNISASPTVYVCVSVRAYVRVCVSVRARARACVALLHVGVGVRKRTRKDHW